MTTPEQANLEEEIPDENRAERRKMRSGCSLLIAAPCLLFAGASFCFGYHDAAKLALLVAAALVVLYLIVVCFIFNNDFIPSGIPCGIVSVLTVVLLPVFFLAFAKARATYCLSNTRQIAAGILMYAQDYGGILPPNSSPYTALISPYVHAHTFITCPFDPNGSISYTFNSNVANTPLSAYISPEKTVLIYEGMAEKLNFRHEGRAAVGFINGSCKLIGPEQAASLIWSGQFSTKR